MPRTKIPKVMQLAELLENDIQTRKLKAGDAYMNAASVAKKLRVSASTANRVLQILDERGVVERAQKRGTVISNPRPERPMHMIERVHMITFQETVKQTGLMTDPVIVGIQRKLPGCMIQFNFLPPMGALDHLERLLDEARRSPDPVGIVLTKAPFHAQKMVEKSGVPTVVHGYPQPSVTRLAWITVDYDEIGRLVGRYCIEKKGCRLILMVPERPLLPGDYRMIDAAKAELSAAGMATDAFAVCCLPPDDEAVLGWLREHVGSVKGKLVVACHPEFLVEHPLAAIAKMGPARTRHEIIAIDEHGKARASEDGVLPRVHSTVSEMDVGERIAELLTAQVESAGQDPRFEILPATLVKASAR